jgi:RimJ/RimL family protein N-acetyltransferase
MTTIEDLVPEQFETVATWLSKPEVNRWLTAEWRDRQATPSLVAIAARNRRNKLFLVRSDGSACGLVALADIDLGDRNAMVWYLLGEARFAGQGITSAGLRLAAHWAFDHLGLAVLYAWIMEENTASRRVLEKSGFRACGRIRRASNLLGRQVDRIYFDLTPEDLRPSAG